MTNPTMLETSGEWFDCINVGDDHEQKEDRRNDADLIIPGYSVVEIVDVRIVNENQYLYEVRLNRPNSNTGFTADVSYINSSASQAFTGPMDILKGQRGRFQFSPAYVRFNGTLADKAKVFGTYRAPRRVDGGRYSNAEYEEFERLEKIFGTGKRAQLFGDPAGYLKLGTAADNSYQQFSNGWDVLGIVKQYTGDKSTVSGVTVWEDEKETENLLALVAPAAPSIPSGVIFLTKEPITYSQFRAGTVAVDLLEYVDPRSPDWNHKFLLDFEGVFGHQYEFTITDGYGVTIGPFYIASDGTDIEAAIESLAWVGEGNVTVHTPGPLSGRFIIEFVGELAGVRVPNLYWQRVINVSTPPENLLGGSPEVPPIVQYSLTEYDYRLLPGTHAVQVTPASRPMTRSQWYGYGYYDYPSVWNYGWGYYPGGFYNYYGGWGGGPLGYLGGAYWGYGAGYYDGYWGPNGYNSDYYAGPYTYDADGVLVGNSGTYNQYGYNAAGFNADGYDPAGFDINGVNADGDTWGYYGVWGHLHTGQSHANHKNDHGIVNNEASSIYQKVAAGSFGVATWVRGGGYVVTEIESRAFWLHVGDEPDRLASFYY